MGYILKISMPDIASFFFFLPKTSDAKMARSEAQSGDLDANIAPLSDLAKYQSIAAFCSSRSRS